MALKNKIDVWVKKRLITRAQADKILKFEGSKQNNIFWRTAFSIAALLIGLGICLIIASNWDGIPDSVKLIGDFSLFAAILWGAYSCILKKKANLSELFLLLSFLMIGATIGLVGQIFHLDGGWKDFALGWCLLGLPFIALSRSRLFHAVWFGILLAAFDDNWENLWRYTKHHFEVLIYITLAFGLCSWIGKKLDKKMHQYTLLPWGFSLAATFMMYAFVMLYGLNYGIWGSFFRSGAVPLLVNTFVFIFLTVRMTLAIINQSVHSFKNNAFLVEIYIFALFCSRFGDLLTSGVGFIIGGVMVLLLLYALRLTSTHIKKMEVFK